MPPILALLLCTGFVLLLLKLDRRQSPDVSSALWLPTLWMFYISSKPLAVWFGAGGEDMESGSPLDRNFQIVLICLGLWILSKRQCDYRGILGRQPWLLALFGFMFVSVLWSDIPFVSFKRWIRELLAVVMALLVATETDVRQAFATILRRTTYVLIPYSMLLIKYFPDLGVQYGRWSGKLMWIGVSLQKNGLGLLCLITSFFLVWTFVRRRAGREQAVSKYQKYADVYLLFLSLWLLKGPPNAYSATSVAVLVMGLMVFGGLALLERRWIRPGAGVVVLVLSSIFVLGTITPFVGGANVAAFSKVLGRDTTLTGRTDIWSGLIPEAMEHPLLGWGFGGFWTSDSSERHQENTAHNGYLDSILQIGFAGLILIAAFIASSGIQAHRALARDFDFGGFWICCLLMTLVHNITETSLGTFTSTFSAFLLFFLVCASEIHSEQQRDSIADAHEFTDENEPSISWEDGHGKRALKTGF